MARKQPGKRKKAPTHKSRVRSASAKARRTNATRKTAAAAGRAKRLIVRVRTGVRARDVQSRLAARAATPEVPIRRADGPVSVAITFGFAHRGSYTIQLFDPDGAELAREAGVSTDEKPDRFVLQLTPAQLDEHILQWTGSVDAFSSGPNRYSVTFDVIQNGVVVPDGRKETSGPFDTTQGFGGCLRLVTS
jgi:hypothetical protein